MKITVKNGELSYREKMDIIGEVEKRHPDKDITEFKLTVDGDHVDVKFKYVTKSFERIRRITGYLVGTLDRFNDAKKAEVLDRVKHGLSSNDDTTLEDIK